MSEQTEKQEAGNSRPQPGFPKELKRIAIAIAILFLFTTVFGQKLPYFLSGSKEKPAEKIEKPVADAANKPAEKPVIKSEEPETVVSPQPIITTPPLPQNDERLHALEEKITSLEAEHENEISALKAKLNAQNLEARNKASTAISALVIFGQLREAVGSGKPYNILLEQLKKLVEDKPQAMEVIDTLQINSQSGIVTLAGLKSKFTPLIKSAITNKYEDILLKTLHRFITIRKVGQQTGGDDESVLARAEIKLAQDDLTAVLKDISQLSPPAKEVFTDWMVGAGNFMDTNASLDKLQLILSQPEPVSEP